MQTDRLDRCKKEEDLLRFPYFSNETAWELGLMLVQTAKHRNAAVALDITLNGFQVFHYCFDGTAAYNNLWIARKNNMVNLRQISTLHAGYLLEDQGQDLEKDWLLDPKDYAIKGGGFPIFITGMGCVGTIASSGLPHEQDHRLVVDTLCSYLNVDLQLLS